MRDIQSELLAKVSGLTPLYLVGGATRDGLLQQKTKDVDVVTELSLDELEQALRSWGYQPMRIGAKHPTISVFQQGERTDFNFFSGDIREDALRRDFTVNAIYQEVGSGRWIDPLDGKGDLENRILKACADPEKCFADDPVRILRMVRFCIKYELDIEEKTLAAAQSAIHLLTATAAERISEELGRVLVLQDPVSAIRLLDQLGYWQEYLPELARLKGLVQNRYHSLDAWEHTLQVVGNSPPRLLLRLAALFHDIGKWETASHECFAWGVLEKQGGDFRLNEYKIFGKNLKPYVGQKVEVHGAGLDHYPDRIQVKRIRIIASGGKGFKWVEQGKRHFLGHERESGQLARRVFPRFCFAMAFGHAGLGGEKEVLWLIENHMGGTLAFASELHGDGDARKTRKKARKFAWDISWDGRSFSLERSENLLALWRADFFGGKVKTAQEEAAFEQVVAMILAEVRALSEQYKRLDWGDFDRFAGKHKITGKAYGDFRDHMRLQSLLNYNAEEFFLEPYLEQEYARFMQKRKQG